LFFIASLTLIKSVKSSREDELTFSLFAFTGGVAMSQISTGLASFFAYDETLYFVLTHIATFFTIIASALTFKIVLKFLAPELKMQFFIQL